MNKITFELKVTWKVSLLMKKNAKAITMNHKGIRMGKAGED